MKTPIRYLAAWLTAAAIGGVIGLAPIASAAPSPAPAPAPTPFESGTSPLVPANVGADPYIPFVYGGGYDLPS